MNKVFLSMALCCGSLWASTAGSATARAGTCLESTTTPGELVSCDLGFEIGSSKAIFGINGMSIFASASASRPNFPHAVSADAFATASFDQWFVIRGGTGSGMVETFWRGDRQDGVRLTQNGVPRQTNNTGRFWVISPFEYNVPFEIKGTVEAYASALMYGDGPFMYESLYPDSGFLDLQGNLLQAVAVQVPEPSNAGSLLIGLTMGLIAWSRRGNWSRRRLKIQ